MLWPMPGTIVYVWFLGVFRHKGIVTNSWWNGKPTVITNSWACNGVAEITWDQFACTQNVFVEGFPSNRPPLEVLYIARSLIGQHYDALFSNCEHFVYKCHGLEPRSPQLAAAILIAAIALVSVVTTQSRALA